MAKKNGARARTPTRRSPHTQEAIVERVVLSQRNAPVTETALVLSEAVLAQLVIRGPLPSAR